MEQHPECNDDICILPTYDESDSDTLPREGETIEGPVQHPFGDPKELPAVQMLNKADRIIKDHLGVRSEDNPTDEVHTVQVDLDKYHLLTRFLGHTNVHDFTYLSALAKVLDQGKEHKGRTNEPYKQLIGEVMSFDLRDGFPLFTHRRIAFNLVKSELFWMLKGRTDITYLHERNNHIWDYDHKKYVEKLMTRAVDDDKEEASKNEDLGPIYGHQWRYFDGVGEPLDKEMLKKDPVSTVIDSQFNHEVDQIYRLVNGLIEDPFSRRHIVTAWNPSQTDYMALPPCHVMFQAHVEEEDNERVMHMTVTQRSADLVLGVPFNVASYALLLSMLCEMMRPYYRITPGVLTFFYGNLHIYANHYKGVEEILKTRDIHPPPSLTFTCLDTSRDPSERILTLSTLDKGAFTEEDVMLVNYKHSGTYKFPMATY